MGARDRRRSHLFDPKKTAMLDDERRKVWQNPQEILGTIAIAPYWLAADLGCGSGFFTVPLSQKVKKVYGIDVQPAMLELLKRKIREMTLKNVEPLLSTHMTIPLDPESLDLLVSINTLHEFNNKERMVNEIRRVLKPEGRALIVDWKKTSTKFGPPVSIRIAKPEATTLFMKNGFTAVKSSELPYHYLLVLRPRANFSHPISSQVNPRSTKLVGDWPRSRCFETNRRFYFLSHHIAHGPFRAL